MVIQFVKVLSCTLIVLVFGIDPAQSAIVVYSEMRN